MTPEMQAALAHLSEVAKTFDVIARSRPDYQSASAALAHIAQTLVDLERERDAYRADAAVAIGALLDRDEEAP